MSDYNFKEYLRANHLSMAKAHYTLHKDLKQVNEEHPAMAALKLSKIKAHAQLWNARSAAFRAQAEKPSDYAQWVIPFRGMGSDGQKALDTILQKQAGWTEHGRKTEKAQAKFFISRGKDLDRIAQKYPELSGAAGAATAAQQHYLAGQTKNYASELKGFNNLKLLNPVIAHTEEQRKAVGLEDRPENEKELSKKLTNAHYGVIGATLAGVGAGYYVDSKLISDSAATQKATPKVQEYFKQRKTTNLVNLDAGVGPQYNILTKEVEIPSPRVHPAVVAHELGHADNARQFANVVGDRNSKIIQALQLPAEKLIPGGTQIGISNPLLKISPAGLIAAAPFLSTRVTDKLKSKNEDSKYNKAIEFIQDRPEIPVAVGVSPLLVEEGRASFKALKAIKKTSPELLPESRRLLGGAFGTYAAYSAAPVLLAYAYGSRKRANKEKLKEQ